MIRLQHTSDRNTSNWLRVQRLISSSRCWLIGFLRSWLILLLLYCQIQADPVLQEDEQLPMHARAPPLSRLLALRVAREHFRFPWLKSAEGATSLTQWTSRQTEFEADYFASSTASSDVINFILGILFLDQPYRQLPICYNWVTSRLAAPSEYRALQPALLFFLRA